MQHGSAFTEILVSLQTIVDRKEQDLMKCLELFEKIDEEIINLSCQILDLQHRTDLTSAQRQELLVLTAQKQLLDAIYDEYATNRLQHEDILAQRRKQLLERYELDRLS
jgi:hypothetical protein